MMLSREKVGGACEKCRAPPKVDLAAIGTACEYAAQSSECGHEHLNDNGKDIVLAVGIGTSSESRVAVFEGMDSVRHGWFGFLVVDKIGK